MKNILFILLAVSALWACNKEDPFEVDKNRLAGSWLLTEITGGIAGTGYEANFDRLQMTLGDRYALMNFDAVVQEGTYQLSKEGGQLSIRFTPEPPDDLIFDEQEKAITFGDQDRQLVLSDPCCDNYVYQLEKDME